MLSYSAFSGSTRTCQGIAGLLTCSQLGLLGVGGEGGGRVKGNSSPAAL